MKKKILYIALCEACGSKASADGVAMKVYGQCNALVKNGWDTWLLCYGDKDDIAIYHINDKKTEILNNSRKKHRRYRIFEEAKLLVASMHFDAVYIRYPYTDFGFFSMIKEIKKVVKHIYIEIPTYPIERWGIKYGLRKYFISRLDILLAPLLKKYVTQFRVIGKNTNYIFGVPAINISNGIDCDAIPIKNNKGSNNEFVIITVSSMNHYHGYDRLIKGLIDYYKKNVPKKKVRIIMVGNGPMKEKWIKLAVEGNVKDFVDFVGEKSSEELTSYFENAHIAIGSLGLHRVGLHEVSTLKTKEYCARGIPFVCSNKEIGFPPDFPFMIKVNPDETPINIQDLIDSYEKINKLYPNYIKDMRLFAEQHLDWKQQMDLRSVE